MDIDPYFVIEQVCGLEPQIKSAKYKKYVCPFHSDIGPSLSVTSDGVCHCFGGCEIDGRDFSNVVGFVKQFFDVEYAEAMRIITNEDPPEIEIKKEPAPEKWKPDYKYISRMVCKEAIPYFVSRGIPEYYINKRMLGQKIHHISSMTYKTLDGEKVGHLPCRRYSIPTFRTKPYRHVDSVSLRLDEEDAMERLSMIDTDIVSMIEDDLFLRGKFEMKDVLYALFGPKYITLGDGTSVFQGDLLAYWDNMWVFPHYEQLGVVESQIDAMLLTANGFPTIAAKPTGRLVDALKNVENLVVIRDNDEGGIALSESMIDYTGRDDTNSLIIHPYDEYKDIGEMQENNILIDWMLEKGLTR